MKTSLPLISILIFLSVSGPVLGQWQEKLEKLLEHEDFQHSQIGLSVIDQNGEALLDVNAHRPFIPASTYKLIPCLILYDLMGSSFRFETQLVYTGELLADGVLYGDLLVIGGGDPSFGHPRHRDSDDLDELTGRLVNEIKKAGITCVEGRVVCDASLFDAIGVHESWTWDDLSNYYAAGAYGFNVHENLYHISFARSDRPGIRTRVSKVYPQIPGLSLENEVTTGPKGSGDRAYIYGSPDGMDKEIRGTIPPGSGDFEIKGAIPDPSDFFSHHLARVLEENGVTVGKLTGRYDGYNRDDAVVVSNVTSASLSELVASALYESINLYADVFMKTIGLTQASTSDFTTGARVCRDYLERAGLPLGSLRLADGSGLSMRNRLSPEFLNRFLWKQADRIGEEELLSLLPSPGRGSLGSLMRNFEGRSGFYLKSGSMSGVLAYSGFMETENNGLFAVTLIANGHVFGNGRMRRQMENIMKTLFEGLNE